jgi:hypothetical protein
MSSIPLPALSIHTNPQQQPDIAEQYGRILQLKNMMALAPLQQQEAQQRVQAGQLQLQQEQQNQKDIQSFRTAMQYPSLQGKTYGQIADVLAQKGAISPTAYQAAKKADLDQRKELSALDTTKLDNAAKATAANKQLLGSVMSLPDEALQQNWPQILEQYNQIPGNEKRPLNPNQPLTKEQIQMQGPMLDIHQAYLDDELKRRETTASANKAEADATKAQLETQQIQQYGGLTGPAQDAKYQFLQKKLALGQQLSQDDKAWMTGYQKQKLLVPTTTAAIRVEGMGQTREYPVYDKKSGSTVMVTPNEINRAAKEEPGRYTAASYTPESVGARDTTQYFTKGKGGQQLTAFNTAMQHLDLLDKLGNDLQNSNLQIANKAKQAWAEQTGNPAPANFAAAKNAMAGEVAGALKASGATDQEITKVSETFDRSQSPAQLKGAISTYRALLQSKAHNLQNQYEQGMQGKPAFNQSSGTTVTAPNNKVYTFKDQASADAFKAKAGIQ